MDRLASISILVAAICGAGLIVPARAAGEPPIRLSAGVEQQPPIAAFNGDGNTCRTTGACSLGAGGHSVLSGSFTLNPGVAILRGKDAGSGVFWVGLVQAKPDKDPLDTDPAASIQVMGPADASGWLAVDGGVYYVALTAYGGYQVSVEQPDGSSATTAQRSFTGTGSQVLPLMNLQAGQYTLMSNSSGEIYAQLVSLNGDPIPADDGSAGPNYIRLGTSGSDSRTFTVILDGPYMLAVRTTSTESKPVTWSVSIN
jgi:hypothetical protein